jgi:hypothetical protein
MWREDNKFSLRSKDADQRLEVFHHYAQTLIREPRRERAVIVPGCPFFRSFFGQAKKEQSGIPDSRRGPLWR